MLDAAGRCTMRARLGAFLPVPACLNRAYPVAGCAQPLHASHTRRPLAGPGRKSHCLSLGCLLRLSDGAQAGLRTPPHDAQRHALHLIVAGRHRQLHRHHDQLSHA